MQGERVNTAGQFSRKRPIDHAVAFEPGLTFEGLRHDIDPVMSLPARPRAGMALVFEGFVLDLEALRRESLGQLLCDEIDGSHAASMQEGGLRVNGRFAAESGCHHAIKS